MKGGNKWNNRKYIEGLKGFGEFGVQDEGD